ncbi:hypothetical protein Daus18300_001086 [Diaporthe australafricana]|uniref:Uncharacterized protein n=1 Tax=Diaporthe australafricana TaxID=127596 RepID=A0ABR3XZY5_9PEZI
MPNGDIVPLNTPDLTLCWVLDGSRFDFPDDHVEVGPDFSALGSLTTNLQEKDSKTCISSFHGFGIDGIPMLDPHGLVFTSGGWKADTATTIWDHFELINGSNNIGQTSDNFQSIRSYALTKQLLQISIHPQGWLQYDSETALPGLRASTEDSGFDWWANATGSCPFSNFSGLSTTLDAAQYEPIQATPNPTDSQQVLEFGVPEYISRARFALGNMSGEAFAPGELPYNSTMWLNGSAISLPAPFVDVGHGCRGNSGFGSLGNCVCYKGAPISLDLLSEGRAICNTAPGYVWGFSSFLVKSGLGLEAGWMACCLICYWYLSLRSGLVRKKMMRTAGAMRFSLESSEAVCELEKSAPELSEDGLKARLKSVNVGYRPAGTSVLEKHGGLRYRVVAGLGCEERVEREAGVMDIADRKINEFGGWMKETWRQRKPTDAEVYEDINWDIYQRRRL